VCASGACTCHNCMHANLTLPPTRETDVPAVNASVLEHAVVLGSQG
jgi:hypothetical protein